MSTKLRQEAQRKIRVIRDAMPADSDAHAYLSDAANEILRDNGDTGSPQLALELVEEAARAHGDIVPGPEAVASMRAAILAILRDPAEG